MYSTWVVSKRQTVNLTYGKSYQVLEDPLDSSRYKIINDRGQICDSSKNNFMDLDEVRDLRIEKILEPLKVNKIKYLGEDMYGKNLFPKGKKLLTKDKIYNLSIEWEVDMFINDHWVFYIHDDLNDGDSRGYELHKNDIAPIREFNLSILGI